MKMAKENNFQEVQDAKGVAGFDDLRNDVLYISRTHAVGTVLFFGGDVQDYEERMNAHRDNNKYKQYSLERCIQALGRKYSNHNIILVKANEMMFGTFAKYSFVPYTEDLAPDPTPDRQVATPHLNSLLDNLETQHNLTTQRQPLILIAFSKGCCVLNQVVCELLSTPTDFLTRISQIVWLDGGHAGGRNTWITDERVAEHLASRQPPIQLTVLVSPYQARDPNRSWIGKEQRRFVSLLARHGARLYERELYDDEPGSIKRHFDVLARFIELEV